MTSERTLAERYGPGSGTAPLSGIQALVRLLVDQHRLDEAAGLETAGLVTGYEGSPLGGLDLELARNIELLAGCEVVHRAAVNEELAATALIGSQFVSQTGEATHEGVFGMWYGKSPGLDRASDALRHGNYFGAARHGGVLVVVGDDPTAKSSSLPSASELIFQSLGMPYVNPSDQQDVLSMGLIGIEVSRRSGLWVGMKIVTVVADGSQVVDLGAASRTAHRARAIQIESVDRRSSMVLTSEVQANIERVVFGERLDLAGRFAVEAGLNTTVAHGPRDRIGIISGGATYLDVIQAIHAGVGGADAIAAAGIRIGKVGMPYPLDRAFIRDFASGLEEIIVVEPKRPVIESQMKEVLYGVSPAPRIIGKRGRDGSDLFPYFGDIMPADVQHLLQDCLASRPEISVAWPEKRATYPSARNLLPVARIPFFCSGCPHNRSTQVPLGAFVGTGTGCSAMVGSMRSERVGTVLGAVQMGGEGAQWIGMAPFTSLPHIFQNVGDGTFFHSGHLAVRAAVAADVTITFKLLYNSAVAMTGGQTPTGVLDVRTLARTLLNEGVKRLIVVTDDCDRYGRRELPREVDLLPRTELMAAQQLLAATKGVTVLLYDQDCAAERRRRRRRGTAPDPPRRLFINERLCEGCGDCMTKANCLSLGPVATPFGTKTRVHQSSCNKDYTCAEGNCPSFMQVEPGGHGKHPVLPTSQHLFEAEISEPVTAPGAGRVATRIRFVGIGGSGIVTVAQIVLAAAWLEDRPTRCVDQTGAAQKGGTVISDVTIGAGGVTSAMQDISPRFAAGSCDAYIACDAVAGADERCLEVVDLDTTYGVVNSRIALAGSQIVDTELLSFDSDEYVRRINAKCGGRTNVLDPHVICHALFGHDRYVNIILLGVAFQHGLVPIRAESLERAIELNGVDAEDNRRAFRAGRIYVSDRQALEMATSPSSTGWEQPCRPDPKAETLKRVIRAREGSPLRELVDRYVVDLIGYQNARYARTYAELVERARASEEAAGSGSTAFAEAVATYLYKVMAFKDEYEVARLAVDPGMVLSIRQEFGEDARVRWLLQPPLLSTFGLKRKISLGSWFGLGFMVLRAMRPLRFTPLDPFGHTRVRKTERELLVTYQRVVEMFTETLTPASLASAIEAARLPEAVRGYEDLKVESAGLCLRELRRLLNRSGVACSSSDPSRPRGGVSGSSTAVTEP